MNITILAALARLFFFAYSTVQEPSEMAALAITLVGTLLDVRLRFPLR